MKRTKCYVGKDGEPDRKRGVAGEVYSSGQLLVAHVLEEKGHLTTDQPSSYLFFGERYPKRMAYRSFVCIPVHAPDEPKDRLGVVCFDSMNARIFDQAEVQEYLVLVANRIAAAISVYQQLHTIHQQVRIA